MKKASQYKEIRFRMALENTTVTQYARGQSNILKILKKKIFSTNNSLLSHLSIKPGCKLKPFSNRKGFKIFISHTLILWKIMGDVFQQKRGINQELG